MSEKKEKAKFIFKAVILQTESAIVIVVSKLLS